MVCQLVDVLQELSALRQHGCPPVRGLVQRPFQACISDIYSKEAHGANYGYFQELACPANYLRADAKHATAGSDGMICGGCFFAIGAMECDRFRAGNPTFPPPKDKTPASCLEGVLRAVRA